MTKECYICSGKISQINEFSFKCIDCNYYFSNLEPGVGQDVSGIEFLRRKNFRKLIKVILKQKNKPKIIELGSGDGFFIDECLKANLSIIGSEASSDSLKLLNLKFDIKNLKIRLPENLKDKTKEKFDVIIFNDVFEHLKKLNEVIKCLEEVLDKKGIIIINIPSSDGIAFKISMMLMKIGFPSLYSRLWQKGFSSPHLSYFNARNLTQLFKKNDFDKLDSGFLDTIDMNYKERFKDISDNILIRILFKFSYILFFCIQKLLPKDNIFIVFKKN